MQERLSAIITAAGLGTRALPLTRYFRKELVPVVDRPAMMYVIDELIAAGIDEIVVAAGVQHYMQTVSFVNVIRSTLSARGVEVRVTAPIAASTLGDAVVIGSDSVASATDRVCVALGDNIDASSGANLRRLVRVQNLVKTSVVSVVEIGAAEASQFGCVFGECESTSEGTVIAVSRVIEKPTVDVDAPVWGITGRYILDSTARGCLTASNGMGDVDFSAILDDISRDGALVAVPQRDRPHDVGTVQGILRATLALSSKRV